MTSPPSPPPTPDASGFSTAATTFLRGLVRLLVILLLGGLLGLGIFFGIPYLYSQFILPVEQNTLAVEQLQTSQSQSEQLLTGQLSELQRRVQDLESQQDQTRETLSELQSAGDTLLENLGAVSDGLDIQTEELSSIDRELTEFRQELARLEQQLARLAIASSDQQQQLEALQTAQVDNNPPLMEVQTDLEILKILQVLSRARLFLGRTDIDLARGELQLAQAILISLVQNSTPEQADYFNRVRVRLDLAARNLDETPLLAAEDVEISYQLLLGRLIPSIRMPSPTPEGTTLASQTQGVPLTSTPTPGRATSTPTPPPTATP